MSLLAINEILGGCETKKHVVEIKSYVEGLSGVSSGMTTEVADMWGSVMKHLVVKVLCAVDMAKNERDIRTLYSAPLRGVLTALHNDFDADAIILPFSASTVNLLYQHIAVALRMPRWGCCVVDYCASLQCLLRLRKYGTWLLPERFLELLECFRRACEAAGKPANAENNLTACLAALVQAYPRALPAHIVAPVLDFCGSLLATPNLPQIAALNTCRALNHVLATAGMDNIPRIKGMLDDVAPLLVKLLGSSGQQQSNEALRCEATEALRLYFELYTILGCGGRLMRLAEEIWGVLCDVLHKTVGKSGSLRGDLAAGGVGGLVGAGSAAAAGGDGPRSGTRATRDVAARSAHDRAFNFLDLLGETAFIVARGSRLGRGCGAVAATTAATTATTRRRPRQAPWETAVAGVEAVGSEVTSFCWLRVVGAVVNRQRGVLSIRGGRVGNGSGADDEDEAAHLALSPAQLAAAVGAVHAHLSATAAPHALESIQVQSLRVAADVAALCRGVYPMHGSGEGGGGYAAVLSGPMAALRDHVLSRLAGGGFGASAVPAALAVLTEMLCVPTTPATEATPTDAAAVTASILALPVYADPARYTDEAAALLAVVLLQRRQGSANVAVGRVRTLAAWVVHGVAHAAVAATGAGGASTAGGVGGPTAGASGGGSGDEVATGCTVDTPLAATVLHALLGSDVSTTAPALTAAVAGFAAGMREPPAGAADTSAALSSPRPLTDAARVQSCCAVVCMLLSLLHTTGAHRGGPVAGGRRPPVPPHAPHADGAEGHTHHTAPARGNPITLPIIPRTFMTPALAMVLRGGRGGARARAHVHVHPHLNALPALECIAALYAAAAGGGGGRCGMLPGALRGDLAGSVAGLVEHVAARWQRAAGVEGTLRAVHAMLAYEQGVLTRIPEVAVRRALREAVWSLARRLINRVGEGRTTAARGPAPAPAAGTAAGGGPTATLLPPQPPRGRAHANDADFDNLLDPTGPGGRVSGGIGDRGAAGGGSGGGGRGGAHTLSSRELWHWTCRCAGAALHCAGSPRLPRAEPALGPDVRRCADAVWPTVLHTPAAFDVALLLAAADDPASVELCLHRVRELLGQKANKWDDVCTSSVLRAVGLSVERLSTLDHPEILSLLTDTLDKLRHIEAKGVLMSPATKVDLCRTAMAVVHKADGDLLPLAIGAFLPLLSDASYAVRVEAASHAAQLIGLFDQPQGVFTTLVEKVAPHFTGDAATGCLEVKTAAALPMQTAVLAASGGNTRAQTSVRAVAEVAKTSDAIQDMALFHLLLVHADKDFTERVYLEAALADIAAVSGATSTAQLLTWHLPFLLRQWVIVKALSLRTFPFALLGCASYAAFVSAHVRYILPVFLQSDGRRQMVQALCTAVNQDETALLVANIAEVFATAYLMYYYDTWSTTAKAVCEDYVKGCLSDQRLAQVLGGNIFEVLRVITELETSREDPVLPRVHTTTADRAFRDFAALWGYKDEKATARLLASTQDCAYRLLFAVGGDLLLAHRLPAWRDDRFRVYLALLNRCSTRSLSQAHVFKLVAHHLLHAAETIAGGARELALKELQRVAAATAATAPAVIARFLPDIATRLAAMCGEGLGTDGADTSHADGAADADGDATAGVGGKSPGRKRKTSGGSARPGTSPTRKQRKLSSSPRRSARTREESPVLDGSDGDGERSEVIGEDGNDGDCFDDQRMDERGAAANACAADVLAALLAILTSVADSAECRKLLSGTANPLPNTAAFAGCNWQFDRIAGVLDCRITAYTELLGRQPQPTAAVCLAVLRRLLERIAKVAAAGTATRAGVGASSEGPLDAREAGDLQKVLLRLCVDGAHRDVRLAAGECVISLRGKGYGVDAERWSDTVTPPALPPAGGSDWGLQDAIALGKLEVLRELSAALCSADATQATAAYETLHGCLAHGNLLTRADKPLLEDLAPFLPFTSSKASVMKPVALKTPTLDTLAPRAAAAARHLDSTATWDPTTKPYAAWIGGVVSGMLHGSADPFLSSCAGVALVVPAAAQALLPVALVDLCCTPAVDAGQRKAAAATQRAAAGHINAVVFPNAGRAPLAARIVLRGVTTVQRLLLEDVRRHGAGVPGSREGMRLATPPGGVPDMLKHLCWRGAARGALACGATATALRLAEHTLERDHYGGMILLRRGAAGGGESGSGGSGNAVDALDNLLQTAMFGGGVAAQQSRIARASTGTPMVHCNPTKGFHDPGRGEADHPAFKQTLVDIACAARDVDLMKGVADPSDAGFWEEGYAQGGAWERALVCADAAMQLQLKRGRRGVPRAPKSADVGHDALHLPGVDVDAEQRIYRLLRGAGLHGLLTMHTAGWRGRQATPHSRDDDDDDDEAMPRAAAAGGRPSQVRGDDADDALAALTRQSASALSHWGCEVDAPDAAPALFDDALRAMRVRKAGRFHTAVSALRARVGDALAAQPTQIETSLSQLACLERLRAAWGVLPRATGGEANTHAAAVSDGDLRKAGLLPTGDAANATSALSMYSLCDTSGGFAGAAPQNAADISMPTLLTADVFAMVGRRDLYLNAVRGVAAGLAGVGNANAALALLHRVRCEEAQARGGAPAAQDALPPHLRAVEADILRQRGDKQKAVACLLALARELQAAEPKADDAASGADPSAIFATPSKSSRTKSVLTGASKGSGGGDHQSLLAGVMCTLGRWLGDDKSETRANVTASYLTPAAALVAESDNAAQKSDVFFTLARFLDSVYSALATRANEAGDKAVEEARVKYQECYEYLQKNQGKLPLAKQRLIERTSHHFGVISSKALEDQERLDGDQDAYLLQAIKAYGVAMLHSDRHDLVCTFRQVALWLNNDTNDELHHHLTAFYGKLAAPHKFIPLAYQLVSRLATPQDVKSQAFQSALSVLIDRLVKAHPHHVLHHVIALANGDYLPEGTRFKEVFMPDASKVSAATAILKRVARSKTTGPLLEEMQRVVRGYIEFAFHPINKREHVDGASIPLPQGCKLRQVRDMRHATVTSYEVPVDAGGDYSGAPRVVGFDASYTTAGGINLPKIIKCLGSDGVWHKQLVKGGQDDLRQDSVLEQIFGLCNSLLKEAPGAAARGLRMRTYKVVPLTPTSGVVQWVQQTLPMGEWLLSRANPTDGAHAKYHPRDMTYREARVLLTRQGMNDDAKREAFENICNRFTPVLHYFFLERFPHPEKWVAARGAYTRSTAVASIVGYIMGLGDRHAQNILLDTTTGEVVHIDLGVAFEKGKILPVPELVPFRLTRDVIDGMGITGVEGMFRGTAEATLGILRRNKQLLETVVEVFIYDPLYNYSLNPTLMINKKSEYTQQAVAGKRPPPARAADAGGDNKANPDAELALLRVSEKLDGLENGEYLSVEGQVNTLIRTASSLDTLALMYVGWAAFV